MFYRKFGDSKKFIVFLHGWGSSGGVFAFLKDSLIDDFTLLFLDFPGFGKSEASQTPMTVSDYVKKLKELLDKFEIESLNIVAHSFGGRVAIKFLFYFQHNYKSVSLCLVDSAGIRPRRGLKYRLNIWRYKKLKAKVKRKPELKEKLKDFGSEDYKALGDNMKQTFINVVNEDLTNYAKYIECNTLIVWGSKDRDTKPYMARKLNKLIKRSKLIFLKNAGHFSFVEKKEEFAYVLDRFLKNL